MKRSACDMTRTWQTFRAILLISLLMLPTCPVLAAPAPVAGKATPMATGPSPACFASPSTAAISLSNVSVPAGTDSGVLVGSPTSLSVTFSCAVTNIFDTYDILTGNLAALDTGNSPPGGNGILFTSSVPGIDVLLTAASVRASSGPGGQTAPAAGNWGK